MCVGGRKGREGGKGAKGKLTRYGILVGFFGFGLVEARRDTAPLVSHARRLTDADALCLVARLGGRGCLMCGMCNGTDLKINKRK